MSTDYNYDDKAQFFPYFILTTVAIITIPTTYSALTPPKEIENTAPRIQSNFQPDAAEQIDKQRRVQKRKDRKTKRLIAAGLGWVVMASMIYLMIVTARITPKLWNPYDVLGISRSADEKMIKKHFRRLSITEHPDKRRPDPAKNETVDSINSDWVEKTKAFKALTDEEVRNNYLQYGHPDGKQSFSIGIALPTFIVEEGNGKYVLLLYGALLGVLLPYLVGKWWWGTQKVTKEKILVGSAGKMFTEYDEDMTDVDIIRILSAGDEVREVIKSNRDNSGLEFVEPMILKSEQLSSSLTPTDRFNWTTMTDKQRRQALGLLWAYLARVDLGDNTLNEQKFEVAPLAHALNDAFTLMIPFFGNTEPLLACYRASQCLIQAIPPGGSALLQIPHFTPSIIESMEVATLNKKMTVQSFMSMPRDRRRKLLVSSKLMTDSQYETAMSVASQLPYAKIEAAFFKVIGEKVIPPGSLVQFVVKLRIIPPGLWPIPPVDPKDLEDPDPKEGDLDALRGRTKYSEEAETGDDDDDDDDQQGSGTIQPPLAHAPYFARDYSPRWRIFLSENKQGKIAVPPFIFSKFDKPLFDKQTGKPTLNVQTLKMQFQAPPQEGEYPFTACFVCDSYLGFDLEQEVVLNVQNLPNVETVEDEDDGDISEPEEDSLAGQMQALKGGTATQKKPKQKKSGLDDDDVSSGSDTEGDEESDSDTDTDTDTDEE